MFDHVNILPDYRVFFVFWVFVLFNTVNVFKTSVKASLKVNPRWNVEDFERISFSSIDEEIKSFKLFWRFASIIRNSSALAKEIIQFFRNVNVTEIS